MTISSDPIEAQNYDLLMQDLLAGKVAIEDLGHPLPDEMAQQLVHYLKQAANHYWSIDPNKSERLAEMIIFIGQTRRDIWQIALGLMARGDARKFQKKPVAAWDDLQEAGRLFLSLGNQAGEIGWARSRIGPLYICVELNQCDTVFTDAKKADAIFTKYGETEFLLNLHINQGIAYAELRQPDSALTHYQIAHQLALKLATQGESYMGRLHLNTGFAHLLAGNLRQAMTVSEEARSILAARKENHWLTQTELNIATIASSQGRYRQALQLLNALTQHSEHHFATDARDRTVSCYLFLNRFPEARDLARQVVQEYEALNLPYKKAITLFNLATAEGELSNFEAMRDAVNEAAQVFGRLEMDVWAGTIALWRATIALKEENLEVAQEEVGYALKAFAGNYPGGYINALLRSGQVLQKQGRLTDAINTVQNALRLARCSNFMWSRYSVHLLLGELSEATKQVHRARRHYQAASATIDRVQRGLSMTLRPDFLRDKSEALRALIRLDLADGQVDKAFETLERAKSQTFFGYLNSRDTLLWDDATPETARALDQFQQLREKYHWLEKTIRAESIESNNKASAPAIPPDYARLQQEMVECEKQIRKLREGLYLSTREYGSPSQVVLPCYQEIQQQLDADTLLVEYYTDGQNLWVFTLDAHQIKVYPLTAQLEEIKEQLQELDFNREFALQVGMSSPHARALTTQYQQLASWFYKALLGPIQHQIETHARLVVVPYGVLHYLPFHLLYSGTHYLIQQTEVVVVSAASLLTKQAPRRTGGARVLAYPPPGALPKTINEAEMVHNLFGGEVYFHQQAQRSILNAPPMQLLHIAAHGKFRMDYPELALIELADGPLYTDDLLQQNLNYELITLSACETGQANVLAGDELIGLGRSCLYAGAGALLLTLWRIEDSIALDQMQRFYQMLKAGKSKAAAIQKAQCDSMAQLPSKHPAFWGAFQLVGNADALSTVVN